MQTTFNGFRSYSNHLNTADEFLLVLILLAYHADERTQTARSHTNTTQRPIRPKIRQSS